MERTVNFATLVSTGEKPDAEVHMAGFDTGTHVEGTCQLSGKLGAQMNLAIHLVGKLLDTLKEAGGEIAQAIFVDQIGTAITEHASPNVVDLAENLSTPQDFTDEQKLAILSGLKDAIENMLAAGESEDEGADA